MFNDTLNSSWDERSRRGLTTLTSFGLQALAVGVLLVLPLLRPTACPYCASSRLRSVSDSLWPTLPPSERTPGRTRPPEPYLDHHLETVHAIPDGHACHRR